MNAVPTLDLGMGSSADVLAVVSGHLVEFVPWAFGIALSLTLSMVVVRAFGRFAREASDIGKGGRRG